MSEELRDAYQKISDNYLERKVKPWQDFLAFYKQVSWVPGGILLDIGAGNGRNLSAVNATLRVAFDLSYELLQGYTGPDDGQRIAGSLPNLPFRKNCVDRILLIAVIHHFRSSTQVVQSLHEVHRVSHQALGIISVWRKWRTEWRKKIIAALKEGHDISPLVDHERSWYTSSGEVLATRFYHYYTFRELYIQLQMIGMEITYHKYLGGKHQDANIFVAYSQP